MHHSVSVRSLATALLALLGASAASAQLFSEPFPDATRYSLVIKDDAKFGGAHIYYGAMVGGNLTTTGALEVGSRLTSGETGLVAEGALTDNGQVIRLFNQTKAYVGSNDGTVAFDVPGGLLASSPLAPLSVDLYFDWLEARSDQYAALTPGSGGIAAAAVNIAHANSAVISVVTGQVNVLNVSSALRTFLGNGGDLSFAGLDANTQLIINLAGTGDFTFKSKTQVQSQDFYDQIVWNVRGFDSLTVDAYGDTFRGSIFAPTSDVIWKANDLDGQLVAESFDATQSRQFHAYTPWTTDSFLPPPELPEPSTYGLMGVALLGVMLGWRRVRGASLAAAA